VASMQRMEKAGKPFWRVRWREGAKGRRGTPRQKDWHREGLAKEHLRNVQAIEDRRSGGLAKGDGRWLLTRFFEEKFVPNRSLGVTDGTVATWQRRWAPRDSERSGPAQVWHVQRAWGDWSLEDITFEAIEDWHALMRRKGASEATAYMAHDLLVNILNYAVRLRYIPVNEALACRPRYQPKRTVGVWLPDTIERIRQVLIEQAANGRPDMRWRRDRDAVLVAVLAYTPLRPGEALALRWRHVLDRHLWVAGTITPDADDPADRTKTHADRRVPLDRAPFLRLMLLEWRSRMGGPHGDDCPVFPRYQGTDAPWVYGSLTSWRDMIWRKAVEAAGVEYKTPYHLRHSAVSMLIYTGLPISAVADRAGHSIAVCSQTYAHAFETYDHDRPLDIAAEFAAARAQNERPAVRLRAV
jgi:integrase